MNHSQVGRPRKILMTADTVGGVWNYSVELIRALDEHDVHVVLATMGHPISREQRSQLRGLSNLQVYESRFQLEWMENPWEDVLRAGEWLLRLDERVNPDVIHLNGYVHAALPWKKPVLVVAHSCVLSWWSAVKRQPAPPSRRQYKTAVEQGLQAADRVIAPSRAMLEAVTRFYGAPAMGEVIPNGRSAVTFPPGRKEPFILSAGRLWDEGKNVHTLAETAAALEWPVYVAGDAKHPSGGIVRHENVNFLGNLSSSVLASWYGRASIYALPARYEPFGLSALEAALAGCALVLGDIPTLREVWEDAAVYVAPNDSEALGGRLRELIQHPARMQALAARARQRALQFTPERMARAYLSVYSDLMTLPAPSAREIYQSVA
jgi:glycogen synthase